jgi:hypothetical protein
MKSENERLESPPKLVEMEHPYAAIIARGNSEYEPSSEEAERFWRTHAPPSSRSRRGSMLLAPVVVATAVLVALAVGLTTRRAGDSSGTMNAPASREVPAAALRSAPASPEAIVSEPAGVRLSIGERKLSDGSVVYLLPGGSARLRDGGKRTSVVLDTGKVTLAVERRDADSELEVRAGAYRFKVIGTRFSVTRSGDTIGLRVDEGRVAVHDESGEFAIVSAGGDWSNADRKLVVPTHEPAAPPTPSLPSSAADATPKLAEAANGPDCREFARGGEPKKAESCYLERSSGTGLDAETALLEVARLRRDVLGEPLSALNALEDYRKRFPNGSLQSEADLAHVVLLTRLGRHDEALAESQRLLDSPNGRERAFELRVLRGNIFRKGLGNKELALEEYAQAEKLDGSNSEATYLRGSCLEELGDAEAASRAYRRYLEKAPSGKRAAEIRERLGRLSP